MVLIAYCEAADYEIIEAIKEAGIRGYTKFTEVFGGGTMAGSITAPPLENPPSPPPFPKSGFILYGTAAKTSGYKNNKTLPMRSACVILFHVNLTSILL